MSEMQLVRSTVRSIQDFFQNNRYSITQQQILRPFTGAELDQERGKETNNKRGLFPCISGDSSNQPLNNKMWRERGRQLKFFRFPAVDDFYLVNPMK